MDFGGMGLETHTGHFGPVAGSGAAGRITSQWVDHRLLKRPEPAERPGLATIAWLDQLLGAAQGPARGLTIEGLPAGWIGMLQDAGMPLAPAGEGDWRWGQDVKADTRLQRPEDRAGTLVVPGPEQLTACSGVDLKPLRAWVRERTKLRLQAAPGIHFTCWEKQALLISTRDEVLGGFLHGPADAQRQTLAWEPGQALWVKW